MLEEDAGCARHGQQEGVGSQGVARDGVLVGSGALLRVVVLDEGHGKLAVVGVADEAAAGELRPVALVDGVAHGVAEGEVEGCALALCTGNPALHGRSVAVPVFAHGVFHTGRRIVVGHVASGKAFYHVVAESRVAEVLEEELFVGFHDGLHVCTLVVKVAHAAPVVALVVVLAQGHSFLAGFRGCGAPVVVGCDVGGLQLVGDALVGLLGEAEPALGVVVIDDHVGDGAQPLLLEGGYHGAQLLLGAEAGVLIEVVVGCVTHNIIGLKAFAALRYPDKTEVAGQLVGLTLELGPPAGIIAVPIESLQHHAFVAGGPSLGHDG